MIALAPERRLAVSAASGLVRCSGWLYVVADDELTLLAESPAGEVAHVRLFAGELPEPYLERKAAKPDLEALCLLPGGRLLAVPSGSRPWRVRGASLAVGARGPAAAPVPVDFAPLLAALAAEIADLNLEGAAVSGRLLRLLQRGNGAAGINAVIDVDLDAVAAAAAAGGAVPAAALRGIRRVELGALGGLPLGFTDASPLPDGRLVFCAAAEGGADVYADGACGGSAIGLLAADGSVARLEPVDVQVKLEGVDAELEPDGRAARLLLCADADDRTVPAPLYSARLPL